MESEPKLEFTDKRRVHAEDVSAAPEEAGGETEPTGPVEKDEPVEPATATGAGTEPEQASEGQQESPPLPALDVYGLLETTIGMLANGAWSWMGLSPNPFSGEMTRDLAQAKVAIDTVAFLIGQLEPRLSETERRDMQNMLSMLRVNYVQQVQKG